MSQKQAKRLRRTVRKESGKIKVKGLSEFITVVKSQPFRKRLAFAFRVVFKLF